MLHRILTLLVVSLIPVTAIVCSALLELHDKSLASIAFFLLAIFTLPRYPHTPFTP